MNFIISVFGGSAISIFAYYAFQPIAWSTEYWLLIIASAIIANIAGSMYEKWSQRP